MRIICISDTHGYHELIQRDLPKGDVLVHAGDFTSRGSFTEALKFLTWFEGLDYPNKILIAGNHDFVCQGMDIRTLIGDDNLHYLQNSEVTIDGVKFYGAPQTPRFGNWAFNVDRGEEIKKYWDSIPDDTNILITHGPPHKILDKTVQGINAGCEELAQRVDEIPPTLHIFGHIHEGAGTTEANDTIFVNASVLSHNYKYTNKPIIIEI